mgnify:CR=1 FL=1
MPYDIPAPMLAKAVPAVPEPGKVEGGLSYEPKWDGFRALVSWDGTEVEIGSRGAKPLTRYFPELVEAFARLLPEPCLIDGEVVVARGEAGAQRLDWEALSQRIHPAASRVKLLSEETPAMFIAFDLLARGDRDLQEAPFAERRAQLVDLLGSVPHPVHVTRTTDDPDLARRWLAEFEGAGLDGVVAKASTLTYQPGKRVMMKIKHRRTADCVVAGFRWHKSGGVVGSLLLGLHDEDGALHHVGVTASFTAARRKELVEELAPYRMDDLHGHPWAGWGGTDDDAARAPGSPSRWTAKKDLSWEPLRPELVCEVAYDYFQGDRFRHATTFVRWRADREPSSCGYDQAEVPVAFALSTILG